MSTPVAFVSTTIVVMKTTGEKLRHIRELAGESQDDAARVAHVKKQAISKIERDQVAEPGARTMLRLAKHYGVSLGWLLGMNERKEEVSSESETLRLDPHNLSNTAGALERHYSRHGMTLDLKTDRDAERFVHLYQAIALLPDVLTPDNLIELGSTLEAIAPLGEGGSGRASGLSSDGNGGRNVARGRARN